MTCWSTFVYVVIMCPSVNQVSTFSAHYIVTSLWNIVLHTVHFSVKAPEHRSEFKTISCHGVQRWITMDPSPQGLNWPWPMTLCDRESLEVSSQNGAFFFLIDFSYRFCSCTLTLTLLLYIKKVLLSWKLKSHCFVQCMNLYQNTMNLNEKCRIKVIRVIFERRKGYGYVFWDRTNSRTVI